MRFLVLAAALLFAACSGGEGDGAAADAKYQKDLSAATEQARAKLPWFWEHFDAPQVDEYDFSLKVALPRRDGQAGTEEAWVEKIAKGEDKIVGELTVDPKFLGDLKEGAIVEFGEKQIIDWAFWRGIELIGHYTTRVMLPRMDRQRSDDLRSVFGENPK